MSYFEKSYVLEIILASLIVLVTASFPNIADKINNLVIVLAAGFMTFRLNQKRNETKRSARTNGKPARWKNIFVPNDIMDEREKLIHLKANNFSLIIIFLLLFAFLKFNQTLRITGFYYLFSIYLFLRSFVGLIYSRIIEATG